MSTFDEHQSDIEELLDTLLNGNPNDVVPQSRIEEYILGLINGTVPETIPISRIGAMLEALCVKGLSSGGGDGTQTYPFYAGPYLVTPKADNKTVLPTKDHIMRSDVTVSEIAISRVSNTSGGVTITIGK